MPGVEGEPQPASQPPIERGSLANAKKSKPFRIFDFAWRRVPLIAAVGIPVFLVLNVLLAPFASPVYIVDGTLLINPAKEPTISGRDRDVIQGDVASYMRTLVLRFTDREVLREALARVPREKRPDFLRAAGDSDRAVFRLMAQVKVEEVPRTNLIRISMQGGKPAGLAETLDAVLDAFIDKLKKEQQRQYDARLSYLNNEREKVAARAEENSTRVLALARTMKNQSLLNQAYTAHLAKVELVQKLYWEAQATALNKKAAFEQAEKDQRELSALSLAPFADERVADNFGINQIERWTYEKSQELRANIDGLTPDNQDRKYVENRMQAMDQFKKDYKKTVSDATIRNLTDKRSFELASTVIAAKNASEAAEASSGRLREQLDKAIEEASNISQAIFEASELTYNASLLRDRLASINSRIDDAELEAKSPLPVTVDKRPVTPEKAASTNASKLRMLALAASFGLVGGLCLLFDFFDGRIRCREDLAAALGGPGAEPIPATRKDGAEDPDFSGILARQPHNPATVAIRDLAATLLFERERTGARLMCFAGANAQAGTTSVCLSAARTLSSRGLRVLMAEMPTPAPGLAALAGVEGSPSSSAQPDAWTTVVPGAAPGLDLMPWNSRIAEDEVRAKLPGFLSKASAAYDMVLLDVAPLQTSDIAHEAAVRSHVALFVTRQDAAFYRDVRSGIEWAAAGGVPAVTAVLNFEREDPVRVEVLRWIGVVQEWFSSFHRRVKAGAKHRFGGWFNRVRKP